MTVRRQLLTPNEWSRPQKKLGRLLGIVMHWTADPRKDAVQVARFFEGRRTGTGGYGSAHYIVGHDGIAVQCIPWDEAAYHCGSSERDPESGRVYTDYARRKFGRYAEDWTATSPNFCTLGIEMCPTDWEGGFSEATVWGAAELCAYICRARGLSADDITTHHDVVGWKDCPRLWTARRLPSKNKLDSVQCRAQPKAVVPPEKISGRTWI